ncbi:MAG: sugar kinase [Chitinophagaceae bacterium]|nr:sugar kinase [Chitinophagaceae bacterium]
MKKIFCFGELLLRYSPQPNRHWIRQAQMAVYPGGAELNVAAALASWKVPVKYFTAIPKNYLSADIVGELAEKGVDVSSILYSGKRIGIYYLLQGSELKGDAVIYDREDSSFASLKTGEVNWEKHMHDCEVIHWSAITPALNADSAALCREAVCTASQLNKTLTVDLNYRARLWQYGVNPPAIMDELVSHCHIIMGNIWSAEKLLGIKAVISASEGYSIDDLTKAAKETILRIREKYPKVHTVALTFRLEKTYFAVMQRQDHFEVSETFSLDHIIDRAGSGDCFMAGILYGYVNNLSAQETLNLAAAAAVGKMHEKGDCTKQTIQDVRQNILQYGKK